jgi:carbon storage regulator
MTVSQRNFSKDTENAMLVLTRKTAETIHIGNDIVIKVISCGRGRVKIGVEAPANVRLVRGELLEPAAIKRIVNSLVENTRTVTAPVA